MFALSPVPGLWCIESDKANRAILIPNGVSVDDPDTFFHQQERGHSRNGECGNENRQTEERGAAAVEHATKAEPPATPTPG